MSSSPINCIYRSLSYEDLRCGWLHCQRCGEFTRQLFWGCYCSLWWLDTSPTINAHKQWWIKHMWLDFISLSYWSQYVILIYLVLFYGHHTPMCFTWLWNQSTMALQGKLFCNTIETCFGLFGWVFPNVHRLQLQKERILPLDSITKTLGLKTDMSTNLHSGHLNHKISIGLRLALTRLIKWSLIISWKYGLRLIMTENLGRPKKLVQNGI